MTLSLTTYSNSTIFCFPATFNVYLYQVQMTFIYGPDDVCMYSTSSITFLPGSSGLAHRSSVNQLLDFSTYLSPHPLFQVRGKKLASDLILKFLLHRSQLNSDQFMSHQFLPASWNESLSGVSYTRPFSPLWLISLSPTNLPFDHQAPLLPLSYPLLTPFLTCCLITRMW